MIVEVVGYEHDILAVNKPVGMDTIQNAGWITGLPRLIDVVYAAYPQARFLNRIDRDTSGIVLFGLTKAARSHLSHLWFGAADGRRKKLYLAVIEDPPWDDIVCDMPLKNAHGGGEDARSDFRVLERAGGRAIVEGELVSHGRTHQLRRHLKMIGYPIQGDKKYGGKRTILRDGQLLHSWKMELPAEDGTPLVFQSKVPGDMGFRVPGGTVRRRLHVTPLTPDQQQQQKEDAKCKLPTMLRPDGMAWEEYMALRRAKV